MRKVLSVITFILAIWQCTYSYSKDIVFPNVKHASQNNIFIKKITILSAHTQVDFLYRSNESNSRYIYLSLPKDGNNSMYLKVKNMKYKATAVPIIYVIAFINISCLLDNTKSATTIITGTMINKYL